MIILVLAFALSPLVLGSNPKGLADLVRIQQQVQSVLTRCEQATVGIDGGGSGVIVSEDGIVLTAAHVSMVPGRPVQVTLPDGRDVRGESLGLNRPADAGVIKIVEPGPWPFVPMAKNGSIKAGDWCFALGHPSGFDPERGVVLRVGRVIGAHALVMRTDCHLIGGDSGGPLFDLQGRVIAIHSRVSEDIDDNFHAPIDAYHRHWSLFLNKEAIEDRRDNDGGFLGVQTELTLEGALIVRIVEGTPAAASDLQVDDIVTNVGGVVVYHPDELGWALTRHRPETVIPLRVLRRGRSMTLPVKIGVRPEKYRG